MEPPSAPSFPLLRAILAIVAATILAACENDMKLVHELTRVDTLPVVASTKIELLYSENGIPKLRLTAPSACIYNGSEARQVFPEGLKIVFYDSLYQPKAEITADYGINYEQRKTMEAHRNVVVTNYEKQERIYTEKLIWDQNRRVIHTDVFIKITTPNDILFGDNGFEADESFERWIIRKPSGEIKIEGGI